MTVDIAADRAIIAAAMTLECWIPSAARTRWPAALDAYETELALHAHDLKLLADCNAERAALKAEVERRRKTGIAREAKLAASYQWAEELKIDNTKLRAALEWYATWLGAPGNYPNIAANEDRGERARAALDGDKK